MNKGTSMRTVSEGVSLAYSINLGNPELRSCDHMTFFVLTLVEVVELSHAV